MELDQRKWKTLNILTYHLPRQQNCAVVGNSGILRNSSCGEDIDSNDFVFRCNIPDVNNYVKDVGTKTNVNIVFQTTMLELYKLSLKQSTNDELLERLRFINDSILWYPENFQSKTVTNVTAKVALSYLNTEFNLSFRFAITAVPLFTHTLKRLLKVARPTTGMRAIIAALSLCGHVNVYGFYPYAFDQNGNNVSYHYYGPSRKVNDLNTPHNFSTEFQTLQALHEKNILRLVTDKCNK
ncbi:alpha-2,8-sialyltransferase 8B-like [Saccoglossus kowalevskii]|uniref:Alpha-2,8-sialyltransferase 8B-like n=1 Tax=Saccoglossus kowalevskii TaxID=10224 RepID=A0ABM0M5A5_SACKO|nr:PREDICTED: alpha-2,8-sialyltransferase 8B-like [Saccoglossus kowalevskii]